MKKTYMQPAMLVVKIRTANMLQNSMKYSETTTTSTKGNLTKRRGIFQDDSEEDQSIW